MKLFCNIPLPNVLPSTRSNKKKARLIRTRNANEVCCMSVENNQIRKGEYFFLITSPPKKDGARMKWTKSLATLELHDSE